MGIPSPRKKQSKEVSRAGPMKKKNGQEYKVSAMNPPRSQRLTKTRLGQTSYSASLLCCTGPGIFLMGGNNRAKPSSLTRTSGCMTNRFMRWCGSGLATDAAWPVSIVSNGSVALLGIQPYFGASLLQFFSIDRAETWSLEHSEPVQIVGCSCQCSFKSSTFSLDSLSRSFIQKLCLEH